MYKYENKCFKILQHREQCIIVDLTVIFLIQILMLKVPITPPMAKHKTQFMVHVEKVCYLYHYTLINLISGNALIHVIRVFLSCECSSLGSTSISFHKKFGLR